MSMEVRKESNGLKNSMVTREELAIINQFTKRALKEARQTCRSPAP